ncbi:N-acetyltransferase [Staphylococcus massiliensis]|uniref:N-acetyltransferase n=1 Tax=Staphylococcus massiliensis TaxID=555791 RepID=UPI00370D42A5
MDHIKTFIKETYEFDEGTFVIEGPLTSGQLSDMTFDEGLDAFRIPIDQFQALLEIADLPEGRIYVIRKDMHIVGYVTYHYPDPLERWSNGNLPYLIELGAIELSLPYRHLGLGGELIRLSTSTKEIEDYIIITTEYYWHWDLKNTGLNVFQYKELMQKLMFKGGLEVFSTDDPEITSHSANCLMARIGKNIDLKQMNAFDNVRFMNRFFF